MDIKQLLTNLVNKHGISGDEYTASKYVNSLLSEYLNCEIDSFGNVYGSSKLYDDKKKTILLDAHIDEIGMIVTYITDEGFLKVANCGGIDNRVLLAQQVDIFCKTKTIKGVIISSPPHIEKDDTVVPEIDDLYIDIGMSKAHAEKIVSLGDKVSIRNELVSLQGNVVTSNALDNRAGVAAILYALELLKNKKQKYNMCVLFSSQEEIGVRGAKIGAFNINPDLAIVVDVSFAMTASDSSEKCGKLEKGPMIGIAPSLDREMSEMAIKIAEKNYIPYQVEVMNGTTGTNADVIGVTKNGVKTVTISVPLRYMHTSVEIVDISDVEYTAKLIAKLCESEEV